MFFPDSNGNSYPVNRIRKIVFLERDERTHPNFQYLVEMDDGCSCEITNLGHDFIMRAGWKLIPANPETFVLDLKDEPAGEDPFNRWAVYAWGLSADGGLHPITAGGECEIQNWAALNPDGSVNDAFGGTWPTEEKYLEYVRESR